MEVWKQYMAQQCMYLSFVFECTYKNYKQKTFVMLKDYYQPDIGTMMHIPIELYPLKNNSVL
jgi:hypothetical protein